MGTRETLVSYYERAWRDGDAEALDELLSVDCLDETPPPGFDGTRETQKQIATMMRD